ncbi:chaperone [Lithospermum erythrorhizon]|uniref:protein disulfide-isomerase n=1 Tax=Lithospermum erythrorhizon TaxID=34254 RepID=A0AAV3NNN0_LITER
MGLCRVFVLFLFLILTIVSLSFTVSATDSSENEEEWREYVVTLDTHNFTQFVSQHDFMVVEFYAAWCGACQELAPEWEKAAKILSQNEPPIVLAKVDANDQQNKQLANKHGLKGFPTIKILKDGGNVIADYKGPREANAIVSYVIQQTGPPSIEITSSQDASALIVDDGFAIMGVFEEFSGEEYEKFIVLAERLRSGINFGHTKDTKHLPIVGDSSSSPNNIEGPFVRLYKPFDELFEDFQNFDVDVLEKLIDVSSTPLVTYYDHMERYYLRKFLGTRNAKAMLYVDYTSDDYDAFKSTYYDVAKQFKGKGVSFLMGDVEASQKVLESIDLNVDQVPILIIETKSFVGIKYIKPKVSPEHILSFVKDFKDGKLQPYRKSAPIPEVNDGPIKIVVHDNLQDMLFNSGKNVLLEFTASWSEKSKKFGPILEDIAHSFQDDDIMIATFDTEKNDYPTETFKIIHFPTLYFATPSGTLLSYDGDKTKEAIIDFIQKNRDGAHLNDSSTKEEL